MRRLPILLGTFMILSFVASPTFAKGGGGFEFMSNAGSEWLNGIPVANRLAFLPTGAVTSFGGSGYYVSRGGWKIGGFGLGFFTSEVSLEVPGTSLIVNGAAGGFGGLISGSVISLGPINISLNARLGAGGIGVSEPWKNGINMIYGMFCLYGSLDAELGVVVVPAMMLSAFGGVGCLMPIPGGIFVPPIPTPVFGVRMTWGTF